MESYPYKPKLIERRRIADEENNVLKLYLLENKARNNPWKSGEKEELIEGLKEHSLVKGLCIGTAFSDKETGITKLFYVNPELPFLINNNPSYTLRNSDLSIIEDYGFRDGITIDNCMIPEMTCAAETVILAAEQTLLAKLRNIEDYKRKFPEFKTLRERINELDFTKFKIN